jgi:electron transfer flavoprotein alpha subunit
VTILAFLEHAGGAVDDVSLEALTLARRLAEASGRPVHAVTVGWAPSDPSPLGVAAVHVADDDRLREFAPAAWAGAVAEAARKVDAAVVVAPGTERGTEVAAHAAAILDAAMAANCTGARADGDRLEVTRVRWGGSLLEEAVVSGAPAVLTVAPHAVAIETAAGGAEPDVVRLRPSLEDADLVVRVVAREEPPAGTVSLGEARVVVGGGRGMGGADGFEVLEELAALLGGAVGCSRAVTSAGWRPHSDQIGQTGARIAPELYIACGISGAIQHIVGCKAAKRIMTVNTDPEAPILAQSDYAIIGDARQVVAALVEALRGEGAR